VRILLDECVDQRFRRELGGHEVSTVQEAGWAGKKNSELLKLAQEQFEVFITVDRNLYFQQSFSQFKIIVIILSAPTNRLQDLRPLAPKLLDQLSKVDQREAKVLVIATEEGSS
jgi:predicted nuclease of predicted toxin-antitoxin system